MGGRVVLMGYRVGLLVEFLSCCEVLRIVC